MKRHKRLFAGLCLLPVVSADSSFRFSSSSTSVLFINYILLKRIFGDDAGFSDDYTDVSIEGVFTTFDVLWLGERLMFCGFEKES